MGNIKRNGTVWVGCLVLSVQR